MSNSADNSPSIEPNLDESSDVIELTEEVRSPAPVVDDFAFAIPEFKKPSGQAAPVVEDEPDEDAQGAFDREELVRTVRMEAFDRHQLELLDAVRKWSISARLSDQRFAPDILVVPPRVLTKKWQDSVTVQDQQPRPGTASPENRSSVAETVRTKTITDEDIARAAAQSAPPAADPPAAVSAEAAETEDFPELELDSEILEDATPLPGPPPKPDVVEPRVPDRPRQVTQPVPSRPQPEARPEPKPEPRPEPKAKAEDDLGGIVQELLDEKKPKVVQSAAEIKRQNWFVDVFTEEYLRTLPRELGRQTEIETNFIVESLGLKRGARVFDLACGFGRHSINLAKRGYEVAGLDLSMDMLQRALAEAQKQSLFIKFIHGDMRELNFNEIFDACFLWHTSFGYFDDRTNFKVLQGIHRALKPGGRVLIDMVNRDYVVAEMPSRTWWEGHECVFLEEVEFDYDASVIHTKRSFIYEDGSPPREFNSYIRLYSLHELNQILGIAGFDVLEVSGELGHRGSFLGPNSHRLILLAEKR